MSDSTNTQTITADPILASTPPAIDEPFQSVLERQLKHKPKLDRIDYKSLDLIPDAAATTPTSLDIVPESQLNDYLKSIEVGSEVREKTTEKEEPVSESPIVDSMDLSDINFSEDEPVQEDKSKGKKSKQDNIAELRKKAESYEAEVKSRDEKLAEYQKRLDDMEAQLEKTAFEKSPKFQKTFQQPYEAAIEKANEFAKLYTDESITEKALSLQGKERIDFIDESFGGGAASAQFLSFIDKADQKRGDLETAINNYKETSSQFIEQDIQERNSSYDKLNTNFDKIANRIASKVEYFRKGDDADHNKKVEERLLSVKNIVNGTASENDLIVAPFMAAMAKDLIAENKRLVEENSRYKNRVSRDNAATPTIKRGASNDGDMVRGGKPKGALDSIKSYFR
jgi:hypothetical protein